MRALLTKSPQHWFPQPCQCLTLPRRNGTVLRPAAARNFASLLVKLGPSRLEIGVAKHVVESAGLSVDGEPDSNVKSWGAKSVVVLVYAILKGLTASSPKTECHGQQF